MKVQLVTPYRLSHLQRYGVTVRGNVTSVYPPLDYHTIDLSHHATLYENLLHGVESFLRS